MKKSPLVALKIVHPEYCHDEEFRRRFRREVVIASLATGRRVAFADLFRTSTC